MLNVIGLVLTLLSFAFAGFAYWDAGRQTRVALAEAAELRKLQEITLYALQNSGKIEGLVVKDGHVVGLSARATLQPLGATGSIAAGSGTAQGR